MRIVNSKIYGENYFGGYQVELLTGDFAVDGDATVRQVNFADAVVGSEYWYAVTDNHVQKYIKVKDGNRDDDWVLVEGIICQRVLKADFTDVTTTGTKVLNGTIPVGAYLEKANVDGVVAFSGDTSATIIISGGVDGLDTDGYMTGTPSLFAVTGTAVVGVPSGVRTVTTAFAPTIVITSAADFTNVNAAAALTVTLFYKGKG
jgi:hypothetical protein